LQKEQRAMAEIYDPPDPNDPNRRDPRAAGAAPGTNPSVESTRRDDQLDAELRQKAAGPGAAVGAGLGCLGMTLLPWMAVIGGIVAAVVIGVAYKGCHS
jgi:hypothetical protein